MNAALRARTGGFTLLEIVILIAVGAILAIVLVPAVRGFRQEALVSRALAETEVIARAVRAFRRDNGFFPRYVDVGSGSVASLLVTPGLVGGAVEGAEGWTATGSPEIDLLANQLIDNRPGFGGRGYPIESSSRGAGWNGPYLQAPLGPDPWGGRYAINVRFLGEMSSRPGSAPGANPTAPAVWVLSAGPDGVFETPFQGMLPADVMQPHGDDVGVRLR